MREKSFALLVNVTNQLKEAYQANRVIAHGDAKIAMNTKQ
jgi:hypothetical protein